MRNGFETNVCKDKKCQKILPSGYKYMYCEACRNKRAHTAKNLLKIAGVGASVVVSIVITIATGGKITPRK